jgi:mannose-6-phosphate isomerase-like protein (cupin superfamily)
MKILKILLLTMLLAFGSSFGALSADAPSIGPVIHLDHEKVTAAFAKSTPLIVTNEFKVQTGNRTGPGEVEIHERDTDIFYILEGEATFITGGTVIEPRESGPGESRAKRITGGEEHHLSKGDVIVIPRRLPHWFKEVKGPFLYYVVKVTQ